MNATPVKLSAAQFGLLRFLSLSRSYKRVFVCKLRTAKALERLGLVECEPGESAYFRASGHGLQYVIARKAEALAAQRQAAAA